MLISKVREIFYDNELLLLQTTIRLIFAITLSFHILK
jgi:hypothetical protein